GGSAVWQIVFQKDYRNQSDTDKGRERDNSRITCFGATVDADSRSKGSERVAPLQILNSAAYNRR
ncbi:MAG TPA: hypothetical protein VEY71_12760, partial [Chitinophagales bacterium]|nr:hypothetical protein [Chitinophagales bacterium]